MPKIDTFETPNRKQKLTAKQYLNQLYRLNDLIDSNMNELKRLKELSTSIPSSGPSNSRGSRKSEAAFARCVDKILDLEKDVSSEIVHLVSLEKEIRAVIGKVQESDQRLLLRLRYIEFLSWEQVAGKMSYSIAQVQRIHNRALKSVESLINDMK